jgi:hypothetical protein
VIGLNAAAACVLFAELLPPMKQLACMNPCCPRDFG